MVRQDKLIFGLMQRRSSVSTTVCAVSLLALSGCGTPASDDAGSLRGRELTGIPLTEADDRVDTLLRLGDYTLARGDAVSAVAMYRRAHQAEPGAIMPLMRLGTALAQLGSFEESAGAFRTALAVEPVNAEAHRGLGNALVALNRPEEGLPHLETALAISNDYRAYNSIGVALDLMGRHDDAQFYYRQGASVASDDVDLLANLSISLSLSGNTAEAIVLAREAASFPSATMRHRQTLALVLGLAGQFDQAADVLRVDLSESDIQSYLDFYATVRSIPDSGSRAAAIGGAGAPAVGP